MNPSISWERWNFEVLQPEDLSLGRKSMVLTTNQNSVCQSQTIQELSNLAKPSGVQESPLNILQLSSSNNAAMNSLNKYDKKGTKS